MKIGISAAVGLGVPEVSRTQELSKKCDLSKIFCKWSNDPNASKCPNRSEWVRTSPNMSENFKKLAKTSKTSAKTSKKIANRTIY